MSGPEKPQPNFFVITGEMLQLCEGGVKGLADVAAALAEEEQHHQRPARTTKREEIGALLTTNRTH